MSERIRYRQVSDRLFESVQVFIHPHNGAQYKAMLDMSTSVWSVVDADSRLPAVSGTFKFKYAGTSAVREALKGLGVVLTRGVRLRDLSEVA